MKVKIIILCCLLAGMKQLPAQSYEAKQLLLDWTKLEQMKGILKDMKEGYETVSKGYTAIRDISQGNFNLHEAFLDGLWLVSPTVRKYWKIPEIIKDQVQIVKEYKSAFNQYRQSGLLHPDEIVYLAQVYNNLFNQSIKNLDDLSILITADQLRMSDDERLSGIDRVYNAMLDKLQFLRSFNNQTSVLLLQRIKEQNEARLMDRLYDVNK
jgi:hypothetical protein